MAGMGRNTTEIEQAVARTLRDSLEKLQHTTDEVNQAVSDLVSACASARPTNALPHMLRAQTAAASLAASLEVLSRFVTSALPTDWRAPAAPPEVSRDEEYARADVAEPPTTQSWASAPSAPQPLAGERPQAEPESSYAVEDIDPALSVVEEALRTVASETEALDLGAGAEPALAAEPLERPDELPAFDISSLSPEEQELHRRANRVAKVSMQDIKMLRPGDVRLGKENNDLCSRLRDDIERAHKEYDRRFHAILDHPVDYFYAWMVEILGEGDPQALGEYPYPSPVPRR
jgi:uncharacterized damage-inducible protein DinB